MSHSFSCTVQWNGKECVEVQYEEQRCPICGKENHCGVVEGQKTCWCMTEKFPEGIIKAISEEPKKCICQNCLHTYKEI
ncbi:cysteine-rich CWC family protein [Lysinibacillus sphaericus]|uniref:Cysteine-rich CWC family protein n=2 Tax=Lysinibacillus TaxID=400634 RepID=A0A2S0JW67_LYSSH|nr:MULTISPECIES: cysteine-rich CWC family protein [Lysinibacillus]AVK95390.1 hypothetical protein LS41612_03380 [Lysinibacillus sphaericus]MCS1383197.1 cysteine-rich CWC family protein [Lysinibacillus sphaericus]MED4546281.1 cysteine-rich CWC family protein [Lysinibacillus sphaericus]